MTLFPSDLRTAIYFVPVPSAIDWALKGGMGRTKSKKPSKHHNPRDGVFLVCYHQALRYQGRSENQTSQAKVTAACVIWGNRPPEGVTWVNFCWVCAAGLSEPLPHSLCCGHIIDPISVTLGKKAIFAVAFC